jgi:hypothetical protein
MRQSPRALWVLGALCASIVPVSAQEPPATSVAAQTQADDYTRYELLAPDSGQFRILYEVTATSAGSRFFYNPIRKGSVASDEAVYDRGTGQALAFEVVGGDDARANGLPGADLDGFYIKIRLPRPVPKDGELRLLIDKTYKDAASYFREGERIVFSRSLGIARNAVVLPAGYELVGCNYPSQVIQEADGRIAVSFMNVGPVAVPLAVKARRLVR